MSISAIIMAVVGIVGAIFGALIMRPIAKSSGITEGAKQANAEQQVIQAKAITESVQERANVEVRVAADIDSALNERLSKHGRPD